MDGILSTDYCYVFFQFFNFLLVDVEVVECMGGCPHRANYVFAIVVVDRLILFPYNRIKSHSVPLYIFLLAQLDNKQGYPTGLLQLISELLTQSTLLYDSLMRLLYVRTALEARRYE